MIKKHLLPSLATARGHLQQDMKGKLSTKKGFKNNIIETKTTTVIDEDFFPTLNTPNLRSNDVIYALVENNDTVKGYSDQTGRFLYQSSRGNNYIMVAYHVDANAILVEPIKNRSATILKEAWENIFNRFEKAGARVNTWILDNECSTLLKNAMHEKEVNY